MAAHLVTTRSYYSLLEGVNAPAAVAARAAELGFEALALTDHAMLTGAVEFALACRKASIRPIFGLCADIKDSNSNEPEGQRSQLTLLSENAAGWSSLCQLSSLINLEDGRPLSLAEVSQHAEGLICLTGGVQGRFNLLLRQGLTAELKRELAQYAEIFQQLYFRITGAPALDSEETVLADLAAQLRVPSVLAADAIYLDKADEPLHRLLCAIRNNTTVQKVAPHHGYAQQGAFPDRQSLDSAAARFPQAFHLSPEIQDRCQFQMPFGVARFPTIPLPPGQTGSQALQEKADLGARKLYGGLNQIVKDRLDHELQIIADLGYDHIFLIMEELLSDRKSV